jgi:plastocyanin
VACLDPAIDIVLSALGARGPNTLVLYLSDNGFLYGQHRLTAKRFPYEESVRVPFVVRYPPSTSFVSHALVENVDIAPTIAELAGIPWSADGHSLVPMLMGQVTSVRKAALVEHCQAQADPCANLPSFNGAITDGFAYIQYSTGEQELYDLGADPYEIPNLAGQPAWAKVQAQLADLLQAERAPPLPDTTIATGPSGVQAMGMVTFTYFIQSRFGSYRCRVGPPADPGEWFDCGDQRETVGPLPAGDYLFEVAGSDESGATDPTPAARLFSVAPGTAVQATDFAFDPSVVSLPPGAVLRWNVGGPSMHTVTDRSGMGSFDSGPIGAGGSYDVTFVGAGTYRYGCTIHPQMTGTVEVPIAVWPETVTAGRTVVVTWAAGPAPAGFAYDVEVRRPGSAAWEPWLVGQTDPRATFAGLDDTGTYRFRGRLRRLSNGEASGYSSLASVVSVL